MEKCLIRQCIFIQTLFNIMRSYSTLENAIVYFCEPFMIFNLEESLNCVFPDPLFIDLSKGFSKFESDVSHAFGPAQKNKILP